MNEVSLKIKNHRLVTVCCRFLWRRFRARKGDGYEGVLQRDESSDPLAVKSLSASGNLLTEEVSARDNVRQHVYFHRSAETDLCNLHTFYMVFR
jgi:hypothetical protein